MTDPPTSYQMAAIAEWMRKQRAARDATRTPAARPRPTMSARPESRRGGITDYDIPEPSMTARAAELGASLLPPVDVPLALRGAKQAMGGDIGGGAGLMALSAAGMVPGGKLIAKGAEKVGMRAIEHMARNATNESIARAVMRNADGSPRTVFHGSDAAIDRFDRRFLGGNTGAADASIGFHFAGDAADAAFYARMAAKKKAGWEASYMNNSELQGVVGEYTLSPTNPLIVGAFDEGSSVRGKLRESLIASKVQAAEYARKHGYDAIIYPHGTDHDAAFTAIAFNTDHIARVKK